MKTGIIGAALLLTGCMTAIGDVTTGMNSLVGAPVQRAFDAIGYPDGQQIIAGNTVYSWGKNDEDCAIKVVAGPDGIIKDWDGFGSQYSCAPYAGSLKRKL